MKINWSLPSISQVSSRLQKLHEDLSGANDVATRNMATALRNSIRGMLRGRLIPPTGKEYRARKGRAARQIRKSAARLGDEIRSGVSADTGKNLTPGEIRYRRNRLKRAASRLGQSLSTKNLQTAQDIQTAPHLHKASSPGEPPAPDVGLLPQAVKAGKVDGELRVGVGGDWEGWEALHQGKGRVKGRRPFMELGFARVEKDLSGIAVSTLQAADLGERV